MASTIRGYEWIVWNIAAIGFWLFLIVERPAIWPMLDLLLPFQVGINFIALNFHIRSLTMYWSLLFSLDIGLCWILYAHLQVRWLCLIGLVPLGRTVRAIWSDRAEILAEEDE